MSKVGWDNAPLKIIRRIHFAVAALASVGALLCAQPPAPASGAELLRQFHFESKPWPNLHHFLYVMARWRNNAPDRFRVAVRQAPLDVAGFDAASLGPYCSTVGEITRRTVKGHEPYAIHYKVWQRRWTRNFELLRQYWQPYLDGKTTMDEAIDQIVRSL